MNDDLDSDSRENSDEKLSLSLEFAVEIMPNIPHIGVVFSFVGLLLLNRYHCYFSMILKETLQMRFYSRFTGGGNSTTTAEPGRGIQ